MANEVVRIAAVGDIHCHRRSRGHLVPLFQAMSASADIGILCGDLTDYGLPEEAKVLVEEIAEGMCIPVIAVLGNHDFESGKQADMHTILADAGVTVLDGDSCEVLGIGFAGVKGFAGGFGRHALEPWGESSIKGFVQEASAEALKLEGALARLETEKRIAVLHYAPIAETLIGEPPEIMAFLGSRRLEEPINRFPVDAVFHGHAHHGRLEGRTSTGIPVFNVAMPLLKRVRPDQAPFFRWDVAVNEGKYEIEERKAERDYQLQQSSGIL